MKIGTQVRLPDGRDGTVVFNGLTGVGIKWGLWNPALADFEGTVGDLHLIGVGSQEKPTDWPWEPDAMLREPELTGPLGIECVGEDYEVLRDGLGVDKEAQRQAADLAGELEGQWAREGER